MKKRRNKAKVLIKSLKNCFEIKATERPSDTEASKKAK